MQSQLLITGWIFCVWEMFRKDRNCFLRIGKRWRKLQEKSVQAENKLWNAVREMLDTKMSTVKDVLESLARTQKGNVKSSIENCMIVL